MTVEVNELIQQLKAHVADNNGEVVYWGEKIVPSAQSLVPGQALSTKHQERLSKKDALENLRQNEIGDCHLCPLGDTRIKIAFGVGNPDTRVMFIGEGPGYDEDRKGEPFVGKAGQLLDKIMAAINLDRSKIYIANIVKCHPMIDAAQPEKRGNDRPPSPEEIEKCRPFLMKQISIIKPDFIVLLGGTAAKALLNTKQGITSLRGRWTAFTVDDETPPIQVLPTFHPAALLRDESLKKLVWEDMKQLRDRLAPR